MLIFSKNNNAVFGMVDELPLVGFPEGKAKIKLRNDEFARVFIKTKSGIREFVIQEINNTWQPFAEIARNSKTT